MQTLPYLYLTQHKKVISADLPRLMSRYIGLFCAVQSYMYLQNWGKPQKKLTYLKVLVKKTLIVLQYEEQGMYDQLENYFALNLKHSLKTV